ncbi:MAG: molecular chaperone DnaJ [Endomicrobiia bacterium]
MTVKRDYYEILGVSKTASAKEIEEAYRRLAVQYHPDRVPADKKDEAREKFKEISEAYAVLSDPKKKREYDSYGHAGIDSHYSQEDLFSGTDFGSIFRDIGFGGGFFEDLFDVFGGRRDRRGPRRGADIEMPVKISLEEAYKGTEKEFSVYHTVTCNTCKGSGAKPGTSKKVCSKCNGQGYVGYSKGFFSFTEVCPRCKGKGQVVDIPCEKCFGSGKVKEQTKISIKIPPGVDNGTTIRIKGKGEAGEEGGSSGDLYVVVRIETNPLFVRQGDDLVCRVEIPYPIAVLGGEIEVPTIEGTKVNMSIPPGTKTNKVFRLKNKGMPNLHTSRRGDMYVETIIHVPERLNDKQKNLLREYAKSLGIDI